MTTPSSLRCHAFSILMVNDGAGRTIAVVNAGFLRDRCPQPVCVRNGEMSVIQWPKKRKPGN